MVLMSAELMDIIDDLEFIFKKEKISPTEIDDLKSELKSEEVFSYLNALRNGAKPEPALREELLAGKRSILGGFLFGEMKVPEAKIIGGFVDYKLKPEGAPPILFELKPLFEPIYRKEKRCSRLQYLRRSKLNWMDHKPQIEKRLKKMNFMRKENGRDKEIQNL